MRARPEKTNELICLAQHPASRKRGEGPGPRNHHGVLIQSFPLDCRPVIDPATGLPRVVERWEEVLGEAITATPDGRMRALVDEDVVRFGVRCPDKACHGITVYEIVAPEQLGRRHRRLHPEAVARLRARRADAEI